jgi:hypothetical protein
LAEEIKRLECGVELDDTRVSLLMYADDIVLLAPDSESLQQMLDLVYNWCNKWKLSINSDKTKVLHFRKETVQRSDVVFKCGDHVLEYVDSYKYLGLWFDEHLTFKKAVTVLAKSANRALSALFSKFLSAGGMSHAVFKQLYESLVEPVLLYGAAIWGLHGHGVVNTIQNKACRFFLGSGRTSSNAATRGDMGWRACVTKQRVEVFRQLFKLEQIENDRLLSKIHKWSKRHSKSWTKRIVALAKKIDINLELELGKSVKVALKSVTVILNRNDEQDWFNVLWNDRNQLNGNKLRFYRQFKKDLCPELYTQVIIPRPHRKVLSKFRAGNLPLNIETGRYNRPPIPLTERFCPFCKDCIENELHFLLSCPIYDDLRYFLNEYMNSSYEYYQILSPNEQLILIMNDKAQLLIARVLFTMFQRRKSLLI